MRLGTVDLAYIAADHEGRLKSLEKDRARVKYWAGRVGILAGLWTIGIVANLKVETVAELVVAVLKRL